MWYGDRIIEIRPSAASDLIVGMIPTSHLDENGEWVQDPGGSISEYDNFYCDMSFVVNADATVFYTDGIKYSLR